MSESSDRRCSIPTRQRSANCSPWMRRRRRLWSSTTSGVRATKGGITILKDYLQRIRCEFLLAQGRQRTSYLPGHSRIDPGRLILLIDGFLGHFSPTEGLNGQSQKLEFVGREIPAFMQFGPEVFGSRSKPLRGRRGSFGHALPPNFEFRFNYG
jgi:hypothetical protein